jgi:nicotinamide riboside kinase
MSSKINYKKDCVVVNLIGGPGTGKSILAADLFSVIKRNGITCDVSWEYIKRKIREKAKKVTLSQIYLFGKQQFQLFTLKDEVYVIITDSPLLLNPIYDKDECPLLKALVLKEYNKYDNLLYFVERDPNYEYETEGRYQDKEEAKIVDEKVKSFLFQNEIEYTTVCGIGPDVIARIVNDVKNKLNK